MKDFAIIYFWYENIILKILRIALFVTLFLFSILSFFGNIFPNIPLILFSIFLIWEVFFRYKISKLLPDVFVSENSSNPLNSFSLEALSIFQTQINTKGVIHQLLNLSQIKFIIGKSDATNKDVYVADIDKSELANKALDLSRELKGKYITTLDLFVSYLLLTEDKSKFLFNRKLKEQDIKNILLWAKNTYAFEDSSRKKVVAFAGEGVAEDWVYGWTNETQKYMVDLSKEFLSGKPDFIGRQNEYKQIVEGLSKGGSIMLVGESGSGKDSAVKQLAIDSFMGKLKGNLFHQKIFQLMVDAFMAGAQNSGELEERLNTMVAEVAHSGNVIVYIPEFQNILGSSSFHLDISGALIPYLKREGGLRIIAAVSPGAYKKFVEPMHSLLSSFSVISFNEPPQIEVLDMLFKKTQIVEDKNKVILTYKAILSAVEYADKYVKEKVLPGSAVILLEDTANSIKLAGKKLVGEQDVLDQVEKKINVTVGEPKPVEKELLLNLETEIHKRIIDQSDAVSALAESIRRQRMGLKTAGKPISFLFMGPTGVGKTETAKALAEIYFGNSSRLVRLDMSEFAGVDGMKRLLGSPPGEGDEKGQLTEPIYDSPYSLVLLDEFEKADQKILDLFLQVFDDGRLTDNKGKTVSFSNTIIIATSNAASEYIREQIGKGMNVDKTFQSSLVDFLQTKGIFKPELLNRFDDIIVFKPLGQTEIMQIVRLLLKDVAKKLSDKDINILFDDKVVEKIAHDGFDKDFGARPLRRFIQSNIEDSIAQKILKDEIKRGNSISVSTDSSNNITLTKV